MCYLLEVIYTFGMYKLHWNKGQDPLGAVFPKADSKIFNSSVFLTSILYFLLYFDILTE